MVFFSSFWHPPTKLSHEALLRSGRLDLDPGVGMKVKFGPGIQYVGITLGGEGGLLPIP